MAITRQSLPTNTTASSSSNTPSAPITPQTEVLQDGTIEILEGGWVKGVELTRYSWKDNNAILVFTEKSTGNVAFKYLQDPYTKNHIAQLPDEDPKKDEWAGYDYETLRRTYKSFIKPSQVDAVWNSFPEDVNIEFKDLADKLYEAYQVEDNKNPQEVWLRMVFKDDAGVEPKYVVGSNTFLGSEKYHPDWKVNEKSPNYSDKHNFTVQEKGPDFTTPSMSPLNTQAIDVNEVFGGLSTPDVNLLS